MVFKSIVSPTLLLLLIGCTNPFTTRDVEIPPINQGTSTFDLPTTVDVVFSNLKYALIEKNPANYMRCLIDSALVPETKFVFIPDQNIQVERFANWSIESERDYFTRLSNEESTITVEFDHPVVIENLATAETEPFSYHIRLTPKNGSPVDFRGLARMKLVRNKNEEWSIYYWEDRREDPTEENTWSLLKSEKGTQGI
jgi:hypothetical protein